MVDEGSEGGLRLCSCGKPESGHLLDTQDWRCYRQGIGLFLSESRLRLTVLQSDPFLISGECLPIAPARVDGAVASIDTTVDKTLRPVTGGRELLPMIPLERRPARAELLNRDAKCIARGKAVIWSNGQQVGNSIELYPLRGYREELEEWLKERAGRPPYVRSHLFEAFGKAADRFPGDYGGKYRSPLSKGDDNARAGMLLRRDAARIFAVNLPRIGSKTDFDYLHDIRVSGRRLRSLVKGAPELFSPEELQSVRIATRWISRNTGEVRDLQVFLSRCSEFTRAIDPGLKSSADDLFLLLKQRLADSMERMTTALGSSRMRQILALLNGAEGHNRATALDLVQVSRQSMVKALVRLIDSIEAWSRDDEDSTHRIRIRFKNLRYLIEVFYPVVPKKLRKKLRVRAREFQNSLGNLNDLFVERRFLLGLSRESPEMPAVKALVQLLEGEIETCRDQAARGLESALTEYRSLLKKLDQ